MLTLLRYLQSGQLGKELRRNSWVKNNTASYLTFNSFSEGFNASSQVWQWLCFFGLTDAQLCHWSSSEGEYILELSKEQYLMLLYRLHLNKRSSPLLISVKFIKIFQKNKKARDQTGRDDLPGKYLHLNNLIFFIMASPIRAIQMTVQEVCYHCSSITHLLCMNLPDHKRKADFSLVLLFSFTCQQ